jgi:hypothetical protein
MPKVIQQARRRHSSARLHEPEPMCDTVLEGGAKAILGVTG